MKKPRNLEELKRHYAYYQRIYQQANPKGKTLLRGYLGQLKQQIQSLEEGGKIQQEVKQLELLTSLLGCSVNCTPSV